MDTNQRPGAPILRPKLDRREDDGPSLAELIKMAMVAAVAVAGVGVVVAASVPSIDLFGIYAMRDSTATSEPATRKDSPRTSSPASSPATSQAPPAPAPAPLVDPETDEPPTLPDDPVSPSPESFAPTDNNDPPPSVRPRPTPPPERTIERDIALLRDLKPAVALPPVTDIGDTTISYLHEAEQMRFDDVQLLTELAAIGDGQTFRLERDGQKNAWTIRFAGPANVAFSASDGAAENNDTAEDDSTQNDAAPAVDAVVADVWCVQSSLMFRWRAEAKDIPASEQLRNAAMRFSLGTHHQVMALRDAVAQRIHTLDLSDRSNDVAATIAHPPRADSLHLEVLGVRDMPVNAYYENDIRTIAVGAAAASPTSDTKRLRPARPKPPANDVASTSDAADGPERVTILFDKFVDGEQPQLWIDARRGDAGDVTIQFASRIVRGKIVDDLTARSLELYRLPREQKLASVERDWKNAHDATVFLDRRIGETKAGINPTVSVRTLQSRLVSAQREYKKLDDELKRIKGELAWVDAANRLVQAIDDRGQLQYRLFAKSGDLEIDLVRGGLD